MPKPEIKYVEAHATEEVEWGTTALEPAGYIVHIENEYVAGPTFARQIDAELALRDLMKLNVNWNTGWLGIHNQLVKLFPNKGELTQYMTEHLQW